MSLLVVEEVSKGFARSARHAAGGRLVLRRVSCEVDAGELVAVWGRRRSGRSTLLRVAAGMEPPSEGAVCFDGIDLRRRPMLGLPGGIGYCTTGFTRVIGESVLEHVSAPLLGGDVSVLRAQARALETLRRVGAATCAELDPAELDHAETVRVGVARALVTAPRLLLVDEPTEGVPPARRRDAILALLRSLADRDGLAILITVEEATDLAGADRALTIDAGELRGEMAPAQAQVVELCRNRIDVGG